MAHFELDRNRCEGHGMCVSAAPGIFDLNEDGDLLVLDTEVTADHVAQARTAADACPVRALQIVD